MQHSSEHMIFVDGSINAKHNKTHPQMQKEQDVKTIEEFTPQLQNYQSEEINGRRWGQGYTDVM